MDKKKIRNYQIFSIIFTFILGTLLHFTYKLSGKNLLVASFSATNESVWEHLKLLFFPMLITTIIGYYYLMKETNNFLCGRTIGIIISILFTIIFFYTYSGILGKNIAIIDIVLFFASVTIGEFMAYTYMIKKCKCLNSISIIILLILVYSFIIFTYKTPTLGIFKDPLTGKYGIN